LGRENGVKGEKKHPKGNSGAGNKAWLVKQSTNQAQRWEEDLVKEG